MNTQWLYSDADRAWQLWQRWEAQTHAAAAAAPATRNLPCTAPDSRRFDPAFGCVDWFLYAPTAQPATGSAP